MCSSASATTPFEPSCAVLLPRRLVPRCIVLRIPAKVLGGDKNDRVRLLASTGIAHLTQVTFRAGSSSTTGGVEGDNNNKALADDRFTQATRIDQLYPMTWIGKGMLNAFNGRLDQARYFFDTTLKHVGPVLPALLASVKFYEKN